MKTKISLVALTVICSGCFSTLLDDEYSYVNPDLQPYVNTFIQEANARGIDIDTYRLKMDFGDLNGEAAGRTYYRTNQIVIDFQAWASGQKIEELVFHELGHLYLHRDHDNSNFGPYAKSIMSEVNDANYEYTTQSYRRQYYVDELFNPDTPKADWMNE